jgi:oligoribonuclease NrnB/cAMP/cGMP phosphodiesterase (DHH superfamily)
MALLTPGELASKPVRVITHNACLDGSAAAALVRLALPGGPFEVHFAEHPEIPGLLASAAPGGLLFFLDLSTPDPAGLARLAELEAKGTRVIWLDHHQSAIPLGERVPGPLHHVDLREGVSATRLTFDYLLPVVPALEPARVLVDLADDRDLWRNLDPRSEALSDAIGLLGSEATFEDLCQMPALGRIPEKLLTAAHKAQARKQEAIRQARAGLVVRPVDGTIEVAVAPCDRYASDVGHALGGPNRLVVLASPHRKRFSMRGPGEPPLNAAVLTARLGGGGHPQAAGAPWPSPTSLEELADQIVALVRDEITRNGGNGAAGG